MRCPGGLRRPTAALPPVVAIRLGCSWAEELWDYEGEVSIVPDSCEARKDGWAEGREGWPGFHITFKQILEVMIVFSTQVFSFCSSV